MKNKEGKKPEPSYYLTEVIKEKYPELLLEYYQKKIETIKPKEAEKESEKKLNRKRGRKPKSNTDSN